METNRLKTIIPVEDRGYSHYRANQAREYLAAGFHDFFVVDSLMPYRHRLSISRIPEADRSSYYIICRPASKSKSVVLAAMPVV